MIRACGSSSVRYATYCGSSPFAAPGTFMLVAHAEQGGVWTIEGGMHALASTMRRLAEAKGATFRFGASVARIETESGRAAAVHTADGERIAAGAIVFNGDVSALGASCSARNSRSGGSPDGARPTLALRRHLVPRRESRRLPADTAQRLLLARLPGRIRRHSRARRLPGDPTVYVCAQDRGDDGTTSGPTGSFAWSTRRPTATRIRSAIRRSSPAVTGPSR